MIEQGGGQVVVADGEIIEFLPLPVGGIVSDAEPEEIAAVIAFLCSKGAGMITGHNLLVDGGFTIQ